MKDDCESRSPALELKDQLDSLAAEQDSIKQKIEVKLSFWNNIIYRTHAKKFNKK